MLFYAVKKPAKYKVNKGSADENKSSNKC